MPSLSFVSALAAAACGGDSNKCTTTVSTSADDQTAVQSALINAHSGDLVCLDSGTFHFTDELSLSQPGVTVRGNARDTTILDFSGQRVGLNALKVTGGDFIVEKLTIKDPTKDGIRTEGVTNVTFRDVKVYWSRGGVAGNGAYGIYPVNCTNVLVDTVEVSGASDAAIYVGQSNNIVVKNSLSHDSVAGIEIENSIDAEVMNNNVHDNVGGILVFNLPQLPKKTGKNANVHDNMIVNNNHANFAAAGSIVSNVPHGTGFLVLAADNFELHGNTITGNNSVGVLVVSCDALAIVAPGVLNCADTGYDHYPEGGFIHANTYANNGTMPDVFFTGLGIDPGPTIFWDGYLDPGKTQTPELKLCIMEASGTTFLNFSMNNETIAMHNCSHPALTPITVTWGVSP